MLLVATWVVLRLAETLLKHGKLEVPPCLALVLDQDFEQLIPHQLPDTSSNSHASFPFWGSCLKLQEHPIVPQSRPHTSV